ncbi:hypothetical protein F7725_010259 [Dissostichus mawsoni]|uniref:Uncharacterized protein n=1 Tax=Dissostichus mawsoni TaxID=36200 RepID=A0A7J5XNF2_DISMA|nr:hypothetical protein F7725_010259 [Dissostichus mawsoni]
MSKPGPLISKSGALTSISAWGRLILMSGPSTFGPFKPNDGILIFGISKPPFGPSTSTAGPVMSTSGVLKSMFASGRFISTSGPSHLEPLMFHDGILMGININISCWDADINVWSFSMWTFQPKGWHFKCRHFESSFVAIKVNFWSFNIHLGRFYVTLNLWNGEIQISLYVGPFNVNFRCFNINVRFRKV